jgi:DNA mismatch repair ATPase MutL
LPFAYVSSERSKKMSTKKKITEKKEFPPALVTLAEKIEAMAVDKAIENMSMVCTRLLQIKSNHGATREMLQVALDNLESFKDPAFVPAAEPAYIEAAREEIINALVKKQEKKQEKF